MEKLHALLEWGGIRKDVVLLCVSGAALLWSMLLPQVLPFDAAWVAIVLCGMPIVLEAVMGLIESFDIKADVLVSIALIAAVAIGEHFAAGEVAFIMQLGSLLEELTVARARAGIERLVHMTPRTARVLKDGAERIVPAEQVQVGQLLRVLPGETVPVDGIICAGQTCVDQAVMTGEPIPVDKTVGDAVSSGTVNRFGTFDMQAVRVGADSALQRMIRLVRAADADKAKIVRVADRWATWVVVLALLTAVLTWVFTHEIIRAVTVLVVFCPCALVLATPTAIMAAIGNATKHGFLVREGDALERLARVRTVAFDKTGTLTCGTPHVSAVESLRPDLTGQELLALAAGAEARSEHPLGKAVANDYRSQCRQNPPEAEDFRMLPGLGVTATVSGRRVAVGNPALLRQVGADPDQTLRQRAEPYRQAGSTVVFVAVDGRAAGLLVLTDTLRPDAAKTLEALRQANVQPVLLTGDHEYAASHIARQLSIGEVHADCRPEDKLRYIDQWQKDRRPVCMIGDGINDAPALRRAFVGIAMGGVGSDIAVEAADITLVGDELRYLPHLMLLSRRMLGTIRLGLTFSMAINIAAVALAAGGWLTPVLGALVHNAGSVLVIGVSALLLGWHAKR